MATPREMYYEKRGQILVNNLKKRHFDAYYCANKEEALAKALELIPQGASVGWGGVMSAHEIGLVKALNEGNYDAIDLLLIEHYDRFMEQTKEAEALLREGDYPAAVDEAEAQGAFCHNAYKGEALRQNERGQVFVGSFDKCTCELPLADLAYYLRRYYKKAAGTAAGVAKMLERYDRSCPLSKGDLTILQGMLVYPEKFLRLVNEYYNRRRACVSPAMQERLSAAAMEAQRGQILRDMVKKGC